MHIPAADGSSMMFNRIARRYDLLNRLMSFGLDIAWRRRLVRALALQHGSHVLDVATGTADVALMIHRHDTTTRITGLDPSHAMLNIGRYKVEQQHVAHAIQLLQGNGEALPFADHTFDAVAISFGIRNVPDRLRALQEMRRVCKPHGRIAVLELCEPLQQGLLGLLLRFYIHHVIPSMGALLSGAKEYSYLQKSIAAFPPPDIFVSMMHTAGIQQVVAHRLSFGAAYLFIGHAS